METNKYADDSSIQYFKISYLIISYYVFHKMIIYKYAMI